MDYHDIIQGIIEGILAIAAPFILAALHKAIGAGFDYLKTHTTNKRIQEAEDTLFNVVMHVEQAIKPALEERAKDGKLTAEDGKYLKDLAVQDFKKQIGPSGQVFLSSVRGDLDSWINTQVEAAVARLKRRYL